MIKKETSRKYLKLLVKIVVLTPVQQSQYGTLIFIIPNKEGNVRFIIGCHRINQKLVRDQYPLPIIGNKVQQRERLQYAIAFYINMLYYNISISPVSQNITMIVTEFGKFRYNRLPVGMWALAGIFQAKVDELIGDIEGVKTYINSILVLSKERFSKHVE